MLIDEIRAWPSERRALIPGADDAVVFEVSPVADWLKQYLTSGPLPPLARAFPNVAPLAPHAWMEFTACQGHGDRNRYGVSLLVVLDRADAAWVRAGQSLDVEHILAALERDDARWCLGVQTIVRLQRTAEIIPSDYAFYIYVRADGTIGGFSPLMVPDDAPQWPDLTEQERAVTTTPALIALAATCFAHCKGVTLSEHEQPRQQRRAAERAGRPALVTYKTIDIAPVTRLLREQGRVNEKGLPRAMHICRGNFAHYAPSHYFGRNPEPVTVFRPMHVRGSLDAGLALKDYRVLPASAPEQAQPPGSE